MHDLERDIRDIPLSQLELSPDNVRKRPADDSAFTELKASIAAHGLLRDYAFMVAKCEADHLGAVSDAAVELVVSEGGGLARFRRCQ